MEDPKLAPETLTAQALGGIDPTTQALIPPIHLSSTFQRQADGSYLDGRGYARADSPAYDEPERLLARLEGGAGAMLFATGMAAATSVFCALQPGDHVVVARVVYWGLRKWLATFATSWGIDVEYADTGDLGGLAAAMRPGRTRLVWVETPANPTWDVTDIAAAADIAHRAGARLVADSTVSTPVLTRPLELGADLVMHSATKYLNGHSDVLAGAVVYRSDDPFAQRIRAWRREAGNTLGPFEAWLLLRGMRTLYLRVRHQCASALAIAEHFEGHPSLAAVLYPGLASHPGHDIAARQMVGGFGGMLSLRVAGSEAEAGDVAARVTVIKRATSLGGTESLIEHRRSVEGPSSPVPGDLLRLSIGLEDPADLIADLEQALAHLARRAPVAVAPLHPPTDLLTMSLRPTVIARGGDLELVGITDGQATFRVSGSPGAVTPMESAIAAQLTHHDPAITSVSFGPRPDTVAGVLAEQVNPAVAAHGGAVSLVSAVDGTVSVRFEGRCVGCTMAEVTLRQGIEPLLRRQVDGVTALVDLTDHATATDPFYKPAKR